MKQISQSKINLWYSLVPTSFYDSWIKRDEPNTGRKDLFEFMEEGGNSLIELGCGTGMNLKYLNENTDFHGLDMNEHMLNSAKRRGKKLKKNLNFYLGDAKKTEFQNSFFDKGILTYALSGIPDGEAVLFELSRIVKDKGKIGILDFANIEPNFIGGVAGITSLDKLVEKPYLKLIEKKSYFMEYSPICFMIHKLYLFENSK